MYDTARADQLAHGLLHSTNRTDTEIKEIQLKNKERRKQECPEKAMGAQQQQEHPG